MRCFHCKRTIAAGAEAQKMIVEYQQRDQSVRTFGYLMPDGPLTAATGQILRGWHGKCFHIVRKRQNRADNAAGQARASLAQVQDTRSRDPGHVEPEERDWREHVAVDVNDIATGGTSVD